MQSANRRPEVKVLDINRFSIDEGVTLTVRRKKDFGWFDEVQLVRGRGSDVIVKYCNLAEEVSVAIDLDRQTARCDVTRYDPEYQIRLTLSRARDLLPESLC